MVTSSCYSRTGRVDSDSCDCKRRPGLHCTSIYSLTGSLALCATVAVLQSSSRVGTDGLLLHWLQHYSFCSAKERGSMHPLSLSLSLSLSVTLSLHICTCTPQRASHTTSRGPGLGRNISSTPAVLQGRLPAACTADEPSARGRAAPGGG